MAEVKVVRVFGLERLKEALTEAADDGFEPHGNVLTVGEEFVVVVKKGFSSGGGGGGEAPTVDTLTGATAVGRNLMKAADQAAGRSAIGAGTGNSNLVVGTTATQAKAGSWNPAAANITDAGAFGRQLLQCASQDAAKTLLGIA